jgi:hypothetical protein
MAFAVAYPETTAAMVLYWPVGGARYRIANRERFDQHAAFVAEHGLSAVVDLARSQDRSFSQDPRAGPWSPVVRRDAIFAAAFARQDPRRYAEIIADMGHGLFDRDTSPGAEPEHLFRLDIPALVVPGQDASHATSAARYVAECLPKADYWDVPVASQSRDLVAERLSSFLDGAPP